MSTMRWREVPLILMYHAVATEADDPNRLCVSPERFAEQMAWLAARGLRGVGVGELLAARRRGGGRDLVGITFDDGYRSVLSDGLPVLRRHGFSATAFVLADPSVSTNTWDEAGPRWALLSSDELRDLAAGGVEIGSHGATHVRLPGLPPARLDVELVHSRKVLAGLVGKEIRGFAYPWGAMDPASRRAVAAAGYEYACAVATPFAALGPMALPRTYAGETDGALQMALKRRLFGLNSIVKGRGA